MQCCSQGQNPKDEAKAWTLEAKTKARTLQGCGGGRAVHESLLSSLDSSPESHMPSLESLVFPGAESRVESRVISLESESLRVIASFSSLIAQLVVSSKLLVK